jgi:hypothetical protein
MNALLIPPSPKGEFRSYPFKNRLGLFIENKKHEFAERKSFYHFLLCTKISQANVGKINI